MNTPAALRRLARQVVPRQLRELARLAADFSRDPTQEPPYPYTRTRADAIYGEAFRRAFEYLLGSSISGHVLEFGTRQGYTARLLASSIREHRHPGALYLYDSFEGLPDITSLVDRSSYEVAINRVWCQGSMGVPAPTASKIETAILRILPAGRLHLVKGFFEETLSDRLPKQAVALVHIDCDLYSSTVTVLKNVMEQGILQDGAVLLFDDYNCNRANPNMGERRALRDTFAEQARWRYSSWFSYGWHGQAFFVHDAMAPGA